MLAIRSHRDRLLAAAGSAALLVTAANLSPARADEALAANAPPPPAGRLEAKQCDGALAVLVDLFQIADESGEPPSGALAESMATWAEQKCPYPFTIAWENVGDLKTINAYGSLLLQETPGKLPPISLNKLGVRLAPTASQPKTSASLELR
jgi:hypothetical protein